MPLAVLQALAQNGSLRATDMVWREDAETAAPASHMPVLAPMFSGSGTVPRRQERGTSDADLSRTAQRIRGNVMLNNLLSAVLLLLLINLPLFKIGNRLFWWWDVIGAPNGVLPSVFFTYGIAAAVAVTILTPLSRDFGRGISVLCIAAVGLVLWLINAIGGSANTSGGLLLITIMLLPICLAALLSLGRFRLLNLNSETGRIGTGVFGGVTGAIGLMCLIMLLVDLAQGIGPVPGWVAATIAMLILMSLGAMAAGVLALIVTASNVSRSVLVAAVICAMVSIGLAVATSVTLIAGSMQLGSLIRALSEPYTSGDQLPGVGWLSVLLFRALALFYGMISLLCSGLTETLLGMAVRTSEGSGDARV